MTQAITYIDTLILELETSQNSDKDIHKLLFRLQELRNLIQPDTSPVSRLPGCGKHLFGLIADDFNAPVNEMKPYS